MLYYNMEKYSGIVQQLLLAAIIGVVSIGVGFVGDLSSNIQIMSVSVQELNVKMGLVFDLIQDHEVRLRHVEKSRR